jgi:hypothetical protein
VLRLVDTTGSISFAGKGYRVCNPHRGRHVEVAIVDDQVQISLDGDLLKTHPIRHDRTKEHGAYATPTDDETPDRVSGRYRSQNVVRVPSLDSFLGGSRSGQPVNDGWTATGTATGTGD